MAILTLPVEHLREAPMELEVDLRPQALDLADESFTFTNHVTGRVVFRMVGHDVLGHGELAAQVDTACVRCLKPAHAELKVKVDEIWMLNHPDEEDVDREFVEDAPLTRSYSGDAIELDDVFRELIMSELPERPLCDPDCKGICPGCGAELNVESCRCHPGEQKARAAEKMPEWKQALKQVKLDPS